MSAAFEKRLKKAIATLENTTVVEATSPRKQKESCTEACLTIRKLLVDEEYWPKSYTSRSITCLFDCLGKDDSSLRLLADQCLNACFRKFILRSHPSRCLAALLNEISRKGSARGFSVAIGMLLPALEKSREQRIGVYAMHFMHALREALRRPEQIVHSAIELWAEKIIAFFRHDFDKTHLNYANNLVHQCVENLSLSGQVNRASSAVLAAVARYVPGMFPIVNGRLLSLLASADEGAQKSQVVGILNTYRRVWSFALEELDLHIVRLTITKILCCLRANSSEIQSAALELLDSIIQSTALSVLTFKPFQFVNESISPDDYRSVVESPTKNTVGLADLDESVVSRFNSCTSLFESATSSRAGDSEPLEMESLEDEYETAANSGDDAESLNESNSFMAAVDPLLQSQLSAEDLLDGTSPESNLADDSFASPVEGPLCECLPTSFGSPSDDFCFFLSTWLVGKFLLTGQPGEIRSNAEVRTSLKILAFKNLASIAAIYEPLADVVVCSRNYKQPITEIYQYFTYDDDVLCMSVYSLFAAMERTAFRSGRKLSPTNYTSGRFLTATNEILKAANPRRLKEMFQIFAQNIELLLHDEHFFVAACDAAIGSVECDYFLLKIARAEFFARIRWSKLSPALRSLYQRTCFTILCHQFFDSDPRVVEASIDLLPEAVTNAEFGTFSNVFYVDWPQQLFAPSFEPFSQVFALHPAYSFHGDAADIAVEKSLSVVIGILAEEFSENSADRLDGFMCALFTLSQSFSPVVFGTSWNVFQRQNRSPQSFLTMLTEIADSSVANLKTFAQILRLVGRIFAGVVENAFIRNANRAEGNQNLMYVEGQQNLEKIVSLYMRVLNLYFTIIRESSAKISSTGSPLLMRVNWSSPGGGGAEESRSYSISHLLGTGVRPFRSSSFLNSTTLRALEASIRGSYLNYMTSLKPEAESRLVEPLNAALDGFCAVLEVLSRDVLNSFIDELFLYIRSITNLSIGPTSDLITQLLKVIFDHNAAHINSNSIVGLKIMHSVFPSDTLEMYLGREINNFSVHIAFLDRSEHMNLHQLRHVGWTAKNGSLLRTGMSDDYVLEIKTRLEQFEKSVTQLLNMYVNINTNARSSILRLMSVLVLSDVRYDKLDPNNRVWTAVISGIRHPALKNSPHLMHLFTFMCVVSRTINNSFDEVLGMLEECVQKANASNVDDVLNAVHFVLIESISQQSTVSPKLISLLTHSNSPLFRLQPAKTIQLWTIVLHWARQLSNEPKWQDLSSSFMDELLLFLDQSNGRPYSNQMLWDVAHSLSVALKTCHSALFRPIDQLVQCFVSTAERDLFLCIPFAMMLLCRSEHDTILLRMSNIMEAPLEKIGACLAKVVVNGLLALTKIHDETEAKFAEKGLSFFLIMLLHVFRAEVVRDPDFSRTVATHFKAHLLRDERFDRFSAYLRRVADLYPKIYGIWMALVFHIDFFCGADQTLLSSNLPFYVKQLSTLLLLQRVNDTRLLVSPELEALVQNAPDDYAVRVLKVGRGKQLEMFAKRIHPSCRSELVEKARRFLAANGVPGLFGPLVEFMRFDEQYTTTIGEFSSLLSDDQLDAFWSWALGDELTLPQARSEQSAIELDSTAGNEHLRICSNLLDSSKTAADLDALANVVISLNSKTIKKLVERAQPSKRPVFISALFETGECWVRNAAARAHLSGQTAELEVALRMCQCLAELADESTMLSSADYRAILCGFHSIPRHLNGFESIKIKVFDRILNRTFVEELIQSNIMNTPIGSDFYSALHELFHRAEMKEYTTNDYFAVGHLCLFVRLLMEDLEKSIPKALRFKLNRNHWNVDLKSECTISERLKEEILESFNLIQRAAHFLFATTQFSEQFHQEARQALIAIIRMPVFSKMFVVPRVALTRDWALNMVGQTNKIHVPLINIHMLNDPEILNDFVRRVLLIGWTQKSQFEDWWMSLFGVLCSTPTGEELESEDVQKTCEQIQASSTAVEALTNMIVQSLLFPTPGDTTVNSEYLIKHRQTRDSYLFLQSLNGKHAAIGRNFIEFGFQPELAFVRNAERGEFNERFYSLGQTSAYFLWSISGELENTSLVPSTPETSTMKSSVSNYLLSASTDLDVSSSLKSLLENFFHWCRQGFHKLPLPLLTSTVRSFAMLSDFFNDPTLYSTVYVEMKLLFNRREFDEHPLNGYLIYLLLKCVAIGNSDSIDPDCTSAEVSQAVEGYVRSGLESTSVFVSSATLHGILYLLQSVNGDSYNAILLSTFDYLVTEINRLNSAMDLLNVGDLEAVEYHELVFVVAFRLFEQVAPAEAESSQKFVAILRVLFMDPRLPTWQRRVLSNGIQTLVIHNVSYCEAFREAAVELFDTYQLRPLHFPYALSVYSTCIYRLAQHESRLTADKMATFESDFQKLLNILSFYAVRKYADNFLPPIARLALVVLDKEKVVGMLLNIAVLGSKSGQLVLSSYDRNIFYLLYYALRFMISEQQRVTLELAKRVVLPRLSSLPSNHFSTYLTTLVLCSLSTEAEVHLLVHLLLEKEPGRELLAFVYGRSKSCLLETFKSLRVPLDVGVIPASAL